MAKFDPNIFQISDKSLIKDALKAIEKNSYGLILTCNKDEFINGMLTDGDVRRALLSGSNLESSVSTISNKNFTSVSLDTSREEVIKLLDGRVKAIPVLHDKKLVNLVTRDYFPVYGESNILVRSRAPVRVSFGGGGSDVTHYFEYNKGAVLNAAVSLYAHSSLTLREDSEIHIRSGDLNAEFSAENLDDAIESSSPFGLFQAILSIVRPNYGFELDVYSDFGMGSGLGGSASVAVSVLGCFNALRQDHWTRYEIAELAFQAERLFMGVAGGWQDQYAAAFGGINYMEFSSKKNIITPLAISDDVVNELQERLILCDTGITHVSGEIHDDQKKEMQKNDKREMVKQNVKITEKLKESLVSGQLDAMGDFLNEGWKIKRQLSDMISTKKIDHIYDEIIASGASGGKLLGAGGGGYFLFFIEASKQFAVRKKLKEISLLEQPFSFDHKGLITWKVKV